MASGPTRADTSPALPSGHQPVTSYDVARLAGVSQSTVSRALRSDTSIAAGTRERVAAAAAELGYTPSGLGRSLAYRSTRTIGMLVTDLDNPFYPHLVAPLHDELTRLGYRMLLLTESPTGGLPSELVDRSVDGAVLTTTTLDSDLPERLRASRVPFVYLTREGGGVAADAAVVDNALGASLMAGALLRHGHRRIAALLGPENTSTGLERERGLRVTLATGDVPLRPEYVRRGPFVPQTGDDGMVALMSLEHPPTAVACANDAIALGAMNAAARLGLSVPDDVSIVGFDDIPQAGWDMIQLSTVRQPMDDMARTAARLLVARIEDSGSASAPERRVFEPTLVLRRTLGHVAPARARPR
jgi:LacI family transcriptional regulator